MFTLVDCNNFWSPSGGGVRRYHLEKMAYFKQQQDVRYVFIMHDTTTYTEQIGENAFIEHLKVPKVMGNWEYRYLLKSKVIEPVLKKIDPDVIEVGSPYFMPKMINKIVARNRMKAQVFGFWHADFPVTYVRRFLERLSPGLADSGERFAWSFARKHYNKMAGIIASSRLIVQRMQKNGLNNVHFVPLGVDQQLFHPDKRSHDLVNELKDGQNDRLTMFYPHRFSNEKGLNILLEAYPLACEHLVHEPTLIIAGTGPFQNLVEEAAEKHKQVHFIGFVKSKEKMAEYFASADLGFALSAWETFGLSLVESLSSGMPLIAANDGAAKEHIESSGAGIILKQRTPEKLAQAIVEFAKSDLRKEMKQKARAYAAELSWENCFERQLAIYRSAVR